MNAVELHSGDAVQTKVFRVDAFRDPNIAEGRRRELEAAEAEPLDMSVARVLSDAIGQTGLEDFGPMDFVERLGVLLGEVGSNENLWRFAKSNFRATCVRATANRLRNHDYLKRNPAIEDIIIDRPIIVVGLPRSGTTHPENLVAADRRLRYLPVYLGLQAVPSPGDQPAAGFLDPRWARADAHWQRMKQNTIMAAMHEHSPDHACGENELQMPDFATYQWEWLAEVPGWRDYYLSHDQAPHYRYGRQMLKAIAYQYPDDRRWILKGNQHSEQLPALLQVYPDAAIVQIHRDPLAILQSVLTMRGLSILAHQKRPDIATHVAYWIDRIERMLRAYIRDMSMVPKERLHEVMFRDVIADDVGTAQKLLEFAGLPSTPASIADMRLYMDRHPRGKDGRVVYDLAGDFNLDIGALRQRFSFYTDLFAVRQEVLP